MPAPPAESHTLQLVAYHWGEGWHFIVGADRFAGLADARLCFLNVPVPLLLLNHETPKQPIDGLEVQESPEILLLLKDRRSTNHLGILNSAGPIIARAIQMGGA
jgi:hypothetical protein